MENTTQVTDPTGKITLTADQGGSLNFSFDSWGNIIRTRLELETIQTKKANAYGQIEELWDANSGTTRFEYNAFGELTKQTDAKNNVTEFTYDRLGRIKTRTINSADQTTYNYVVSGNGRGNVAQILRPAYNTTETYTYDAHGRPITHLQQIQGQSFTFNYQYDPVTGNISQIQYPSDLTIQYQYDSRGFLNNITSATHQKSLFSDPVINHWGQYTRFTMGKGTSQFNTINSTTYNNYGQPTNIRTLNASGTPVTRFNYTFTYNEATGNMLSRRDHITGQSEIFQYDALQRLTQFQVGTSATVQQTSYASDGNILSKFDAGTYAYEGMFKNAVTSVSVANTSATNPAPLAIPKHAQSIQYTPFDQPATITENNRNLQFGYGADDMRNYSVMKTGTTQNYIRYHLGSMDREVSGSTVRDVHHIEGPSGTIAIIVKENGVWKYYHTFTDPLGSVLYVFNENGTLNVRQSFDAWGRYRSPTNWNTYTTASYPRTWLYRGYTGHEMLPAFNLINMNGRLYDPMTARMLSADPIINSIYNTQAYNRFSYVWNNPLKFVDPDGYDGRFVQWIKNLFSNKQTDCYSFGDIKVNDRNHRGEAGRNGNFGKAFGGWLKGFFGTGEGGVSLHQANGYNAPRSIAITGFAMNQSSFNFGGSYYSSESYDPLEYALAQGPPGGMLRTAADLTPFVGSSLMMYDGYNEGSWLTFGIGAAFLTWDIFTFGSGSLIRGGARLGVRTFASGGSKIAFRSFTSSNFRHNLGLLTGVIPVNAQAHHIFPQKFEAIFNSKGINIHDPKFGAWWETSSHLKNAKAYNSAWDEFLILGRTQSEIMNFGRQLMRQYGIPVGF